MIFFMVLSWHFYNEMLYYKNIAQFYHNTSDTNWHKKQELKSENIGLKYDVYNLNQSLKQCKTQKSDYKKLVDEWKEWYNTSHKMLKKDYDNCVNSYHELSSQAMRFELSKFDKILLDVAFSEEYVADVYDCTNFSIQLASKLQNNGWNAEMIHVDLDCESEQFETEMCEYFDGKHEIVHVKDVYIESTTGQIIKPELYDDYGNI